MMSYQGQQRRTDLLVQLQEDPLGYIDLSEEQQSDRELCLATLMAYDCERHDDELFSVILETIFRHVPDFGDHKPAFLRFLHMGDRYTTVPMYLHRFGSAIYENAEFLKEALEHDRFSSLFPHLPIALRSDPDLLKLAVEHVLSTSIGDFVKAIPSEVLEEQKSLLFRAVERMGVYFSYEDVPVSMWSQRDFIIKWMEEPRRIPLPFIPPELNQDREVCISLYRSQHSRRDFADILDWMSKSFFADKEFVLECLSTYPTILKCCQNGLENDFDVRLAGAEATIRVGTFSDFIKQLGASFCAFADQIRSRIDARDEFMAFLECSWKSRRLSVEPLSGFECGEDTARGLNAIVASYLGFPNKIAFSSLKYVWDEIVAEVVQQGTFSTELIPLIRPEALAESALKAIERRCPIALQVFPEELWSNRKFVLWAASKGFCHTAISKDFFADPDICGAYYYQSAAMRARVVPCMSESLKSDWFFVMRCTDCDPMILGFCKNDEIRYDAAILRNVVVRAEGEGRLDDLPAAALAGGWSDALIFFAKSLRVTMENQLAFTTFEAQMRASPFFANVNKVLAYLLAQRIGTYFGINSDDDDDEELDTLFSLWSNRSIYFLALGGDIQDLCRANMFRPEQQQNENKKRWEPPSW